MESGLYFNRMGKWVKLGGSDEIEGMSADDWVAENMKPKTPILDRYFVVRHNNDFYDVHPSQIILVKKS